MNVLLFASLIKKITLAFFNCVIGANENIKYRRFIFIEVIREIFPKNYLKIVKTNYKQLKKNK